MAGIKDLWTFNFHKPGKNAPGNGGNDFAPPFSKGGAKLLN